jgi:hypothetical protein
MLKFLENLGNFIETLGNIFLNVWLLIIMLLVALPLLYIVLH